MMVNDLKNHPVLTAVIETDDGLKQSVLVRKIRLAVDDHAYALVDDKGEPRPANAEVKEGKKLEILFFNAIWIEGRDVWTLNIGTKEKKLRIGKLINLG